MIMWKLRAAVFALLHLARPATVGVYRTTTGFITWFRRYTRPTRHHVRSLRRAGLEAVRADMLILAQYNERVRAAKLSLETSNWDTVRTRRLRAKLAAVA